MGPMLWTGGLSAKALDSWLGNLGFWAQVEDTKWSLFPQSGEHYLPFFWVLAGLRVSINRFKHSR